MIYKNLKIIALLAFLLQINQTSAQFVPCERSYTVFFNPLLQKINDFSDFRCSFWGKAMDFTGELGNRFPFSF